MDPDPRIHASSQWIRIRLRILLLSSLDPGGLKHLRIRIRIDSNGYPDSEQIILDPLFLNVKKIYSPTVNPIFWKGRYLFYKELYVCVCVLSSPPWITCSSCCRVSSPDSTPLPAVGRYDTSCKNYNYFTLICNYIVEPYKHCHGDSL
jgi:hypothetical protein